MKTAELNFTLRAKTTNISIVKMPEYIELNDNENTTFTLNITNLGNETVYNVSVRDSLPKLLINTTPAEISYNTLSPGESKIFEVNVTANSSCESQNLTNIAYAEWDD
ncbi:MAG: hypothetical protein CVT89_08225, partial [Candidatus Altiarchaeales archaeon HGW-Altiarchaeales-2]